MHLNFAFKKSIWISVLLLFTLHLNAQNNTGWTSKNPFDQRYFIQNLGQFDENSQEEGTKIVYASYSHGTHFYFTNKGFILKHFEKRKKSRRDIRKHEKWLKASLKNNGQSEMKEDEEEEEKYEYEYVPVFQEFIWEGCSANAKVTVEEELKTEALYPDRVTHQTIRAKTFKKLIYHDIYPGIDVEFNFPEGKGIKYNYIVNAGANAKLIVEKWKGESKLTLNGEGDLKIESSFGKVKAKRPVSYTLKDNASIESSYAVNANCVRYTLPESINESFVIDPWVITPAFPSGSNSGYDVDFDIVGNTYIYGGTFPHTVIKYDPAGTQLWTYTTTPFVSGYYGDFAVDYNTGNSYIVNGYCGSGEPNVIKISAAGAFLAQHFGSADMNEMWRIAYSSCTNQAVIGGGGTSGTDQICYLDTNLTALTTVNVLSTTQSYIDIALLAVDNYGSCYFVHADNTVFFSGHENNIVKAPMPSFSPITYSVPSGHMFQEVASPTYVSANGYNGITVGNQTLFTYDSYFITKRNANTGALILSKQMSLPPGGNSIPKSWGGISSDDCLNLFVASRDTVYQFDSMLVQQNIYVMPGTIIDLKISKTGNLHVVGQGFASVIQPTGLINCSSPINPNLVINDATCFTLGSASVNPTGGAAPYTITWSTTPVTTGTSVTDLPTGSYTVTISDVSCSGNTLSIPFNITTGPGGFSANPTVTNITCNGLTNGSISLAPSGGVAPYTYAWDTLGLSGSSATGLGAGVYGVTVTDSAGCTNVLNIAVLEPAPLNGTTDADTVNCFGDVTTITTTPTGGTTPYSIVWNTSPVVTGPTLTGADAGIYSITITDSAGCTYSFTDTLYEPAPLTLSVVTNDIDCVTGSLGNMTATVGGGTLPYDYNWSNDATNNTNFNPSLPAGIYVLTVTDDNNCTISLTDTVFETVFPTISFAQTLPCYNGANGAIVATPTGGTSGVTFNYSWLTTPVTNGTTLSNASSGTYVFSVEANGCTVTYSEILGEEAMVDTLAMTGISCGTSANVTLNLPSGAQAAYQWYLNGIPIPGATSSSYDAIGTDVPLITATWFLNGCNVSTSVSDVESYPVVSKDLIPNVFSPNGDQYNNTYYPFVFVSSTDQATVSLLFEEFHIQIFNRWGQLLYETNDPNLGWNGEGKNGSPCPEGVYYSIIKYKALCDNSSETVIYNGSIHLIR